MVATVPASSTLSVEEFKVAVASISVAGMLRLRKAANRFSYGRIDADDLLQKAFESALEGKRKCPHNIDVVKFLVGAIKSISSNQFKSLERSPEFHTIPAFSDDDSHALNIPDETPKADQLLISEQETAAIHSAILSLFADDEIARLIVEGDMDDIDAIEIRDLTGLDEKAYASKRRLIRRRIDKAYPKGWKP